MGGLCSLLEKQAEVGHKEHLLQEVPSDLMQLRLPSLAQTLFAG